MPSIIGVERYILRAQAEEKLCLSELNYRLQELCQKAGVSELPLWEMTIKLRNISRDVGFMRRLLADLKHGSNPGDVAAEGD